MPKNAHLSLLALVLLAGSLVMLWFVILSAVVDVTPLNKTYFLQATTGGITGARPVTQWTYFYACGVDNKGCGSSHAAPAFGFAWDANAANVPPEIAGSHGGGTTSSKYYYLWRFGWVFLLLTLFFETLAFFAGFLACCGRLGSAISYFVATFALLCYAVAASLTTATFVSARNQFTDEGRPAQIGSYAFGFLWGSFAALLIADILFLLGMRSSKNRGTTNGAVSSGGAGAGGGRRFWRRKRSTRSARSRSYDGRRVKDEYS